MRNNDFHSRIVEQLRALAARHPDVQWVLHRAGQADFSYEPLLEIELWRTIVTYGIMALWRKINEHLEDIQEEERQQDREQRGLPRRPLPRIDPAGTDPFNYAGAMVIAG